MKMALIIFAHKQPDQIERFIKRMHHPSFDFYIHLDKKISIDSFIFLEKIENVFFIRNRKEVIWASHRFTEAILNSTEEVLASNRSYDFVGTFSGQDYPVQSAEAIANYYANRLNHSFFSMEESDSFWWSHAITRINKYHFTYFKFRGRYRLQFIVNALLPKRAFPIFDQLYGGPNGSWWTLSTDCASYLVDFMNKNKRLQRFAKYTWCSDEFLIATIIMNSIFKNSVINDCGRYIDWSQGGANPKILRVGDFESIISSNKLFARKFDLSIDASILNKIDQRIDSSALNSRSHAGK
jgi:hypothetical protein